MAQGWFQIEEIRREEKKGKLLYNSEGEKEPMILLLQRLSKKGA
jgi:hypothetical protein